jgi:O-antigen ligase
MDLAINHSESEHGARFTFVAVGLSAVALAALLSPPDTLIYLGAALGAIALVLAGGFTARDRAWLGCFLVLEELLPYANILPFDPESRWFLRYPLLLALTLPAAPQAVRSGILWAGGFKALTIYYMWAAVSVLYSIAPATSAGRLVPAILLYAALAVLALEVKSREDLERLMGYFALGCGIMVAIDLIALVALPSELSWRREEDLERFSGLFGAPNVLGDVFQATCGAAFFCWRRTAGLRRAALILVVAGATLLAILADSRTPFITLLAGIGAYAVWKLRFRGVLLCAAAILAAVVGWNAVAETTRAYFNRDVTTLTGRLDAWQFEWHAIKEHPFLGYGYAVEGEIFRSRYFQNWEEFWNRGANTPLHNSLFSTAIGVGVPALLLWLFVTIRPFVDVFRRKEDPWHLKPFVLLVVLPILLNGITESLVAEPRYPRGILFVFCWAVAERRRMAAVAEDSTREQARRSAKGAIAAINAA